MDPLSISTAIFTFLGASGACAQLLRQTIKDANHAPDAILAVSNEITDINVVLNDLQNFVDNIQSAEASGSNPSFGEALSSELVKARSVVSLLRPVVSDMFATAPDGKLKFQKMKWVRKKTFVLSLQLELVAIKRNLNLLLTSINATTTRRIFLRLEQIQTQGIRNNVVMGSPIMNGSVDFIEQQQGVTTDEATVATHDQSQLALAPPSTTLRYDSSNVQWQIVRQIAQFGSMTFHLHRAVRCNGDCDCACHSRQRFQTPGFLNRFFGQLFVGYAGLPIWVRYCNRDECVNQYSRAVQISYTFPSWLLSRAIDMTAAMTYTNEPHLGLKIRHRVQSGENSVFNLARTGNLAGVQELYLKRLISPNDLNASTGQTALYFATEHPHGKEVAHFLLDVVKIDPFVMDDGGFSVAHHLSQAVISSSRTNRDLYDRDRIFAKIGADHSEIWDFTHVHNLVVDTHQGDLDVTLLNPVYRKQVDNRDAYGRTALYWAAMRGDTAKVTSLLVAGADDSVADNENSTALHAAIQGGNPDCVGLLLRRGSNVHARDRVGNTGLQVASFSNDAEAILELLYSAGASVNVKDKFGTSVLASAACLNHHRNAKWLLSKGADINSSDVVGCTPVFEAVRYCSDEVLDVLLQHGALVDFKVTNGRTLLHALASSGTCRSTQILLNYPLPGLDADCRDQGGQTAWDLFENRVAKPEGMSEAFCLLLHRLRAQGADREEEEDEFVDALDHLDLGEHD